jgi:hypothetical protein
VALPLLCIGTYFRIAGRFVGQDGIPDTILRYRLYRYLDFGYFTTADDTFRERRSPGVAIYLGSRIGQSLSMRPPSLSMPRRAFLSLSGRPGRSRATVISPENDWSEFQR